MSAPDMPGLEASDGPQATSTPPGPENESQGLDDAALGGPDAWAAAVAVMLGQGPTPPASVSQVDLHRLVADLEVLGVQTRPCAHGGWFCWSESWTAFCRELADLRAVARRAKREATAAGKRESHAASIKDSIGRLTPSGKASPRWDRPPKPVKEARPPVDKKSWRADVFEAMGRELARALMQQDRGASCRTD